MDAAETTPDFLDILLAIQLEDADIVVAKPVAKPVDEYYCLRCRMSHCSYNYTDAGHVMRNGRKLPDTHYGVCRSCDGGVREVKLGKIIKG